MASSLKRGGRRWEGEGKLKGKYGRGKRRGEGRSRQEYDRRN